MPVVDLKQTNFVSGEVSPQLLARHDIQQYYNAADKIRNAIVLPLGGVKPRPGTKYIATVPEKSAGVVSEARIAEFQFSTEQAYLFVFSHEKLEIYRNNALQATLVTPWGSDDLWPSYDASGNILHTGISWASDLDTMLVMHEDYSVRRIQRAGSHTSWTIEEYQMDNIQRFAFGDATYGQRLTGATETSPYSVVDIANIDDGDDGTKATLTLSPAFGASEPLADRIMFKLDFGASRDFGAVKVTKFKCTTNAAFSKFQIAYSLDDTTWTELSPEISQPVNSSDEVTGTYTKTFTARYVAVCGVVSAPATTYELSGIDCFDTNVGVDEIQSLAFNSASGAWVATDVFTMLLEDEETEQIVYDASSATMAVRLRDALERLPTVSEGDLSIEYDNQSTSSATFTITFSGVSGQRPWGSLFINLVSTANAPTFDNAILTAGRRPGEPVWSSTRGYPRCGLFFQGRLWLAGSKSLPNYVWATRSLSITDFNVDRSEDDYGISVPADAESVPIIVNMEPGRHLQVFATSGEFYVPVSELDAITPSNVTLRRTSSHGSKPGTRVFDVDGGTLFIQNGGNALREFVFADTELAYNAIDLSLLSSHLIKNPLSMSLRRSSQGSQADLVHMVNDDGTLTVLSVLRGQNVNGFALWNTDGEFLDAATVVQDRYTLVKRTIDGSEYVFVELFDDRLSTDCAVFDFALTSAATSASAAHLNNEAVTLRVDDIERDQITVSSDTATFGVSASASYEVGLSWPIADATVAPGYLWFVRTLPAVFEGDAGVDISKKKRVNGAKFRVSETQVLNCEGQDIPFREMGAQLLDQAIPKFTGIKELPAILGWSADAMITFGGKRTGACKVLSSSRSVRV